MLGDHSDENGARAGTQEWPRISVIVPSYNQGIFIRQTLESVLTQGYPDLQPIVLDGGSTDQTVGILREDESGLA